jgi:hypothetical protein
MEQILPNVLFEGIKIIFLKNDAIKHVFEGDASCNSCNVLIGQITVVNSKYQDLVFSHHPGFFFSLYN